MKILKRVDSNGVNTYMSLTAFSRLTIIVVLCVLATTRGTQVQALQSSPLSLNSSNGLICEEGSGAVKGSAQSQHFHWHNEPWLQMDLGNAGHTPKLSFDSYNANSFPDSVSSRDLNLSSTRLKGGTVTYYPIGTNMTPNRNTVPSKSSTAMDFTLVGSPGRLLQCIYRNPCVYGGIRFTVSLVDLQIDHGSFALSQRA